MHYFSDPKTGKCMTAQQFLKREKREWGQALGAVAKELFSDGKKQGDALFVSTEAEMRKFLGSAHNFKGRR